jgi:hypothetical protein
MNRMRPTFVHQRGPVSTKGLRPLLGAAVVVRTLAATWRGTLLSCVKDSAWLVVDDVDVVLRLNEIVSVKPADS